VPLSDQAVSPRFERFARVEQGSSIQDGGRFASESKAIAAAICGRKAKEEVLLGRSIVHNAPSNKEAAQNDNAQSHRGEEFSMKSILAYSMASVCLVALTAPTSANAQAQAAGETAEAAETTAQDVIVTARRRDERIQDVPSVINAVTSEEIGKLNLREFNEVATLAPGLELQSNSNGTGGNARLRGVNFDVAASGNNPTVEFYFNDAPITAGVLLQQMYDVGQIEVLRGPQGTLRGRASPSGSITVTSRKPNLYEWGAYVEATGNDIGTQNLQGGINIPVIKGVAAIRAAGVWDQNEGTRVRPLNGTIDARDPYAETWSGRISAVVEPTDFLHFEGTYQRLDRSARSYDQVESFSVVNSGAAASPVLIKAEDRLSIAEGPRYVRQTYNIYNWRAEASLAGQQLIYQGQHYTQYITGNETQDPANFFPNAVYDQFTTTDVKSTSHEVRLQNQERVAGIFDYVVGFFDNKNNQPSDITKPTIVRLPVIFGGGVAAISTTSIARRGNSHETSFFGNLTAHIGESTAISGGVRQIDYSDFSGLVATTPGAPTTTVADTQKVKKLIYSGSIQHFFTPDIMVYASTGTSFRPGISLIGDFSLSQSALQRSFLQLPPETSTSYEAGVKTTLFDKRVRLNLSGYHQKFKNFPYRVPGTGVYYVTTVGTTSGTAQQVAFFNFAGAVPVEVNGVEADFAVDITPHWSFSVVGSYSLGKIKGGTIPCTDLNKDGVPDSITTAPSLADLQAATGANNISACKVTQRSSFLPPFSATVQSEYNLPVSSHVDAYLRGILAFNGQSQGNPTSRFDDVGSYGLLNLFTGIRDPKGMWEVSLYAKNVLDKTVVLTRGDPLSTSYQQLPGAIINGVPTITGRPSGATFTSTYTGITTNQPREFGLNVKFRFGAR
jgi:iron complex outermembrane receptor protein